MVDVRTAVVVVVVVADAALGLGLAGGMLSLGLSFTDRG
jgi:hypothetical protein